MEAWLEVFDSENRGKLNLAYLPSTILSALPESSDALVAEFVEVYCSKRVKGNYKHLRTLLPEEDESKSWDIVRNAELKKLKDKLSKENGKLFKDDGTPTADHLKMIYWAYSPQPDKVKSYVAKLKPAAKAGKRSAASSSSDADSDDSDDSQESPAKKRKSN